MDKHWDHMERLQEKIGTIKRADRETSAIKNANGDSPTQAEVITDFLNHVSG